MVQLPQSWIILVDFGFVASNLPAACKDFKAFGWWIFDI
jgi:hypothetical protein